MPEPLEAISVEDLLSAQAEDSWCDYLIEQFQHEVNPTKTPGLFLDEHGALACAAVDEDLPLRRVAPHPLDRFFIRWPIRPESQDILDQKSSRRFIFVILFGHHWHSIVWLSTQLSVLCCQEVEARTQNNCFSDDLPAYKAARVRSYRLVRALSYDVAR